LNQAGAVNPQETILVYPRGSARLPVPSEVTDKDVAEDYREACEVLPNSAKAAAALGRRTLQYILREKAGVKHSNLDSEIQEVLSKTSCLVIWRRALTRLDTLVISRLTPSRALIPGR
jgi:hypothetical protein